MKCPYSSKWQEQRKAKMKLANNTCEDCGKGAKHVHHIDKTKDNHDLSNLKALCCKCHRVYHPIINIPSRRGFYKETVLGEALRKARKDKALRMIDVQGETGISTVTLSAIETGKNTNYQLGTLRKLADLYVKKIIINLEDV